MFRKTNSSKWTFRFGRSCFRIEGGSLNIKNLSSNVLSKGPQGWVPPDFSHVNSACYAVCSKQTTFWTDIWHVLPLPTARYSRTPSLFFSFNILYVARFPVFQKFRWHWLKIPKSKPNIQRKNKLLNAMFIYFLIHV